MNQFEYAYQVSMHKDMMSKSFTFMCHLSCKRWLLPLMLQNVWKVHSKHHFNKKAKKYVLSMFASEKNGFDKAL
jgi:hypothetical protein